MYKFKKNYIHVCVCVSQTSSCLFVGRATGVMKLTADNSEKFLDSRENGAKAIDVIYSMFTLIFYIVCGCV